MEKIFEKFPFERSGEKMKGIAKLLFVINMFFIIIAYVITTLICLFVEPIVGFVTALVGAVGVLLDIVAVYVMLLLVHMLAEQSENTCILVEQMQQRLEGVERKQPEPKMEASEEEAPKEEFLPLTQVVATRDRKSDQPAGQKFDVNRIPAWKRVQMEQENKQ